MTSIRVGKPDTTPDAPSHTPGIDQGNNPEGHENSGIVDTGDAVRPGARSTALKSTGINPASRDPVHPDSPNLPPA